MFVITSQPLPYHPFPVHHGAVVCMTRSTGYFVVRSLGPWEGLVFFYHFLRFLAKVRLWKPPLHGVGHENFGEKVGWSTHGMLWFPLATEPSEPFWVCGFS